MKKALILLMLAIFLTLCGCADFVGLDEISIVAGIAIDKSVGDPGAYHMTFEVVDASTKGDQQGKKTYIVESEGRTIQAAISNANKFQPREMYFGNAELVIIQQSFAQDNGIDPILESFLRSLKIRDTLQIVISLEETAGELFSHSKDIEGVVSYQVARSLDSQKNQANSTNAIQIYEMYNNIRHKHICLALPFFRAPKEGETELIIDGMAIFRRDKLIGKITNAEMEMFMFITEKLRGGSYTFSMDGDPEQKITVTIIKSTPKLTTEYNGTQFVMNVSVDMTGSVTSASPQTETLDPETLNAIERACEKALASDLEALIRRVQTDYVCDIFGFGAELYAHDPALWEHVQGEWVYYFRDGSVSVETKVKLDHAGMIGRF